MVTNDQEYPVVSTLRWGVVDWLFSPIGPRWLITTINETLDEWAGCEQEALPTLGPAQIMCLPDEWPTDRILKIEAFRLCLVPAFWRWLHLASVCVCGGPGGCWGLDWSALGPCLWLHSLRPSAGPWERLSSTSHVRCNAIWDFPSPLPDLLQWTGA